MIVAQNAAPSMPATAKASPASPPCRAPMTRVPFSVALETDTNLSSRSSLSLFREREQPHHVVEKLLPVDQEEEHRIQHDEQLEQEVGRASCRRGETADQEGTATPASSPSFLVTSSR